MGITHFVYSLIKGGRTTYIGETTNPRRRAAQHRQAGKEGKMKIEKAFSSHRAARRSEASRLSHFRRKNGRNPRHNKTKSGGWRR